VHLDCLCALWRHMRRHVVVIQWLLWRRLICFGFPSILAWHVFQMDLLFGAWDPFFFLSHPWFCVHPVKFKSDLLIFYFFLFLYNWSLLFWLLFVLFEMIYEIDFFFYFIPFLFFLSFKSDPHYFNRFYLFGMIFKSLCCFTISSFSSSFFYQFHPYYFNCNFFLPWQFFKFDIYIFWFHASLNLLEIELLNWVRV
jgi:hypothetical protein